MIHLREPHPIDTAHLRDFGRALVQKATTLLVLPTIVLSVFSAWWVIHGAHRYAITRVLAFVVLGWALALWVFLIKEAAVDLVASYWLAHGHGRGFLDFDDGYREKWTVRKVYGKHGQLLLTVLLVTVACAGVGVLATTSARASAAEASLGLALGVGSLAVLLNLRRFAAIQVRFVPTAARLAARLISAMLNTGQSN